MGPVTGDILANMATNKPVKYDLSPVRADRFRKDGLSAGTAAGNNTKKQSKL